MSVPHPVVQFYEALKARDGKTMAALYKETSQFEDPAFGKLKGRDIGLMWEMLCSQGKDLEVEFEVLEQSESRAKARCEARYTFSKTGRKVHNIISSEFKLENGIILDQRDSFNLRRWAGQAIGWKGSLLGGTDFFKKKLQAQTNSALEKYKQKNY